MNEKLQAHWKQYKYLYLGAGTGVVIATITYAIMRDKKSKPISRDVIVTAGRDVIVTREKVEINTVSLFTSYRMGAPSWVVKCQETGEEFMSQRAAALALGVSESNISRHLNGHQNSAQGYHFSRLGMAA